MKGRREYERSKCWKIGSELGRALPSDCNSRGRSLLHGVLKGKTLALTMKHLQFKEVLSMNVMYSKK